MSMCYVCVCSSNVLEKQTARDQRHQIKETIKLVNEHWTLFQHQIPTNYENGYEKKKRYEIGRPTHVDIDIQHWCRLLRVYMGKQSSYNIGQGTVTTHMIEGKFLSFYYQKHWAHRRAECTSSSRLNNYMYMYLHVTWWNLQMKN